MSQFARVKEMEEYIKRLGELLNLVYKKMADTESKVNSLETELSKVKNELGDLRAENMRLRENSISKTEYEEFMNRLISGLKGLLPETPREETSPQ